MGLEVIDAEGAWKKLAKMGADVSYLRSCNLGDSDAIGLSIALESLIAEYRQAKVSKQIETEIDMTG